MKLSTTRSRSALAPKDHPSTSTKVRFSRRSSTTRPQLRESVNMLCHRTATWGGPGTTRAASQPSSVAMRIISLYSQYSEITRLDRMPRRYELSVRAERACENRDRLVSAAHGLFLRQGWTMTTMTQVAAAVGLARPTVYLHFDPQVALLIAPASTPHCPKSPSRTVPTTRRWARARPPRERRPRHAGYEVPTSGQPPSSGSWTTLRSAPPRQPMPRLEWSSVDMTSSPTHAVSSSGAASHPTLSWMKSGPWARARCGSSLPSADGHRTIGRHGSFA